jgi:SAM-dependent methyltransferase
MNRIHHWICRSKKWRTALETKLVPWTLDGAQLGDDALEIGPGPGLTTELLRLRVPQLTVLELDPSLASSLRITAEGRNVRVVEGDATRMPFQDGSFSAAVALTMLHHVPSAELQDRLFAETLRTLRPGGTFVGIDSRMSWTMRIIHIFDTLVCIDPATLKIRLERVGFDEVQIECEKRRFRFRARKPRLLSPSAS